METLYLSLCSYPLKQATVIMLDTGLRVSEVVALRKTDIASDVLLVRDGKTKNARRALPLTVRAAEAIQLCCDLWPNSEWLFPGRKEHLKAKTLDDHHANIRNAFFPPEFVLHSLRHTFATRLTESS